MAVIEAEGLTKYYDEQRGIEAFTVAVTGGEVFGLLGTRGAGKTTVIRTLMGLQTPTNGGATVLGYDISSGRDLKKMKHEVGYMPSDPSFEDGLTIEELLSYHGSLKDDVRSGEVLEWFGLPTERSISECSDKDRQKLSIVLAFMHDPDLVLVDEPTAGFDGAFTERFYNFIHAENGRGTTVLIASSDLAHVCSVCDRIGIVRNGHLVACESVETLLDRTGKSVRLHLAEKINPDGFSFPGVHDLEIERRPTLASTHATVHTDGGRDHLTWKTLINDGTTDVGEDATDGMGPESRRVQDPSQPTQDGSIVTFTYTGPYGDLFEELLAYTVIDVEISNASLCEILDRCYGTQLAVGGDARTR